MLKDANSGRGEAVAANMAAFLMGNQKTLLMIFGEHNGKFI
jgi:hypothetical protein